MTEVNLQKLYQAAVAANQIHYDENQWCAVLKLQQVFEELQTKEQHRHWFGKPQIAGVYLYGNVGTGKTYLMDLFYQALPIEKKLRMHFHQFMKMVHDKLKLLQGKKNPLQILAKELAKQAHVICFDEFFVVNIVDAMLLGNLFQALYQEKITLLMTSNVFPDELYKDGLQRERFVPVIELIKKNNAVIKVDSGIDYRQGKADYDRAYFYPQSPETQELLLSRFRECAGGSIEIKSTITLNQRSVQTLYVGQQAIWFDFLKLCSIPRSQRDYLALSEKYPYVFLSNLRPIQKSENDLICNFINLIDVFYDAKIKLFILAQVPLNQIYAAGGEQFAFQRTESRLMEMQAQSYLQAPLRT